MSEIAPSALEVELLCEHAAWAGVEARVCAALERAAAMEAAAGVVSLLLTDDAAVRVLNRDYRGKDKATNVLSFPAAGALGDPEGGGRFFGDIAMAGETIAREAQEQGKTFADHAAHMAVHGLLHLLGYDHESEEEAETMEARERAILASLGVEDPYAAERCAGQQEQD